MNIRVSLYFLGTLYLVLGGFISVLPLMPKTNKELKKILTKGKFQIRMGVLGIFSCLIFAFFPYDKILLIGDFFPSLASFILTFLFIVGYIRNSKHIDQKTLSRADHILSIIQVPAGFLGISVGFIHVILPGIILI